MAKVFKFKLAALKKYRERRLLMAKKDMAEVGGELSSIDRQIAEYEQGRKESLSSSFASDGSSNGAFLSLEAYSVSASSAQLGQLRDKKSFFEREYNKHREWVAHLSKELRAVEKIEEKQRARFELEQKKKEKRIDDSQAGDSWARKLGGEEL